MEYCPNCGSVLHKERTTCFYCDQGKKARLSRSVLEYQNDLRKSQRAIQIIVGFFIALTVTASIFLGREILRHK
jgi:hypothetical protein